MSIRKAGQYYKDIIVKHYRTYVWIYLRDRDKNSDTYYRCKIPVCHLLFKIFVSNRVEMHDLTSLFSILSVLVYLNDIEDEFHYVLVCDDYINSRNAYKCIPNYYSKVNRASTNTNTLL